QRSEGEYAGTRPGSGARVKGPVVRPAGAVCGDRCRGAVAKGEGGLGEEFPVGLELLEGFVGVVVEEEVPGGAGLAPGRGAGARVGAQVGTLGAEAEFFAFCWPIDGAAQFLGSEALGREELDFVFGGVGDGWVVG